MNTPLRIDTSKCGDENHSCYKCNGYLHVRAIVAQEDRKMDEIAAQASVHDLIRILEIIVDHASERYPHFESERGQREIAEARALLASVKGKR